MGTERKHPSILIVEDDEFVAADISAHLEALGYHVAASRDTAQGAIEFCERHPPDLVLMDIILAGPEDGLYAAEVIAERFGTPVVFLTSYDDESSLRLAQQAEPYGYLVKPVDASELRAAVSMALHDEEQEKSLRRLHWGADVCEHLAEAVVGIDRDRRIVFANQAGALMLTQPLNSLTGMTWHNRYLDFQGNAIPDLEAQLAACIREKRHWHAPDRLLLRTPAGTRLVTLQMMPVSGRQGHCMGAALVMQDITDLQREINTAASLARVIPVGVFRTDAEQHFTFLNDRLCSIYGRSESELLGSKWQRWVHESDLSMVISGLGKVNVKGEQFHREFRIRRGDGEIVWVLGHAMPEFDESDQFTSCVGCITDITALKQTQDVLAQSTRDYSNLLSNLAGIVYRRAPGPDGAFNFVSDGCDQLTGYSASQLTGVSGKRLIDLVHEDDRERVRQAFDAAYSANRPSNLEYRIVHVDGGFVWVWDQSRRVDAPDGTSSEIEGLLTDITDRVSAERALAYKKAEFESVLNSIPDAVVFADSERRIQSINPAVTRIFGFSEEELLGRETKVLYAQEEDFSARGESHYRAEARPSGDPYEMNYRRKNGEEFVGETVGVPVRDGEGRLFGFVGVLRDITERKQAEAHILRAQERLRRERDFSSAVLDTIGSVVVVLNRGGEIVRFNHAAQHLTGYTEEECLGRYVWDFLLVPEEAEGVGEVFKRLTAGQFPSNYENYWVTRSGERRMIAWSNTVLQDTDGDIEYVIATGIDITDKLRAESQLAKVELFWNEAMEFLAEPMLLVQLNDTVFRANREFLQLMDVDAESVEGRSFGDVLYPQGAPAICQVCESLHAKEDATLILEVEAIGNPLHLPLEISYRVIRDKDDQAQAILFGMRDLTSQRRTEAELMRHRTHLEELVQERTRALEEVNQELEAFSYSVSHDLRAPLRSIDGFSQVLIEDYMSVLDDQGRHYLDRVRSASQRMGNLIDDILTLSRLGRHSLECIDVDLSAIVREVADTLSEQSPERDTVWDITEGLHARVDPRLFAVVIDNLLGNAWKFTSQRSGAKIAFGCKPEKEVGRTVFFVRDNGVGFDPRFSDKLFVAFQRLHADQEFAGSGVGLATVQRIIHRHNGRIWAESEPGEGACFYFTMHCV